jgi:hypothetical protein
VEALLLVAAVWSPRLSGLATLGMLGLIAYVGFLVVYNLLPQVAGGRSDDDSLITPASSNELDLADALQTRLEALLPGTRTFYQVRLRRKFWGWVCSANSRVPSLPWQYQVYTWGARPNLDKIARMLVGPLQWFTPQAKAHELAEDILGHDGMQRVLAGTYFVPSQLNNTVEYRFTPYSLILYRGGRPLGSFCLQARGRYPLWDVVLSRVIMVQGSELDFLRTAHFYGPVPPYFAVPMTRDQFLEIYGKEALERWDIYTSSTLGKATAP